MLEAAEALSRGWPPPPPAVDWALVRAGAVLHDAGKIRFPEELSGPGAEHEPAGEALLLSAGAPPEVARLCRTHARWDPAGPIEDLLVALSDKLWKGRRDAALEALVISRLASERGRPEWEIFSMLDALFEEIAAGGDERLARSRV